jgi:hypothetical protein
MISHLSRELESEADPAFTRTPNGIFLVTYMGGQPHCHALHEPLRVVVRRGANSFDAYEVTPELARRVLTQRAPSEHQAGEYPLWYAEDW